MLFYKHYLALLAVALCLSVASQSQDIIIKQDKTEIQSKVAEITETSIKYKKWENLDGPLYSIAKNNVFMILYSNGQREIIKQPDTKPAQQFQQPDQFVYSSDNQQKVAAQSKNSKVDTAMNYKNSKVKYNPTRLNVSLQSPLSLGTDCEFRIVKNIFNIGLAYDYLFPEDNGITSENFGFIYGSLYAPINRLAQNYEKQDKGLFVFAHAGYGVTSAQVTGYNGKSTTINSGGFTWRVGVDYYITKGFGFTASSYKFKTAYAGLVFTF